LKTNRLSPTRRASSAEGGKKPKPQPQRGNRAFGGFNPAADDFATSVTEKPAAGCALLIPGSGKPNQVKNSLLLQSLERIKSENLSEELHCTCILI
jgi:hypothetical protein